MVDWYHILCHAVWEIPLVRKYPSESFNEHRKELIGV